MPNVIPPPFDKKTCPNCSHEQPIEAVFCQKCGIPFTETNNNAQPSPSTSELQWRQVKKKFSQQRSVTEPKLSTSIAERTCPHCNTIIESAVLEQCPLCMNELPPLPPTQKENLDRMLFTGKKIVSEKDTRIDPNSWSNGKEILNVFLNSALFYIFITMGAYIFSVQGYLDENLTILFYILGSVALGIYPLIYVGINHLHWKKIGFKSDKTLLFIILGILAGIALYFTDFGVSYLSSFIKYYNAETQPLLAFLFDKESLFNINTVDFPLRFAFYAAFLFEQVLEEFLFRGVIHNGIHDVMIKKKRKGSRIIPVVLTTLIYAAFYFLFEPSGFTLIFKLASSLLIGIVYELSDRSLTITISMKIIYVGASILFFFIPLM